MVLLQPEGGAEHQPAGDERPSRHLKSMYRFPRGPIRYPSLLPTPRSKSRRRRLSARRFKPARPHKIARTARGLARRAHHQRFELVVSLALTVLIVTALAHLRGGVALLLVHRPLDPADQLAFQAVTVLIAPSSTARPSVCGGVRTALRK